MRNIQNKTHKWQMDAPQRVTESGRAWEQLSKRWIRDSERENKSKIYQRAWILLAYRNCSVLFSARVRSDALGEHFWQLWLACWDEQLAGRSAESKQNKENKKSGGKQMLLDNNGHGTAATAANKQQLWQRQVPEGEEIRDRRSTDHHWHFELAFLRCVPVTILSPLTSFCANPLYRSLSALHRVFSRPATAQDTGRCALPIASALRRGIPTECVSLQGEFTGQNKFGSTWRSSRTAVSSQWNCEYS